MIYKKSTFEFTSIFASYIREYIELRESFSIKMRVQSGVLRQFDRYCVKIGWTDAVLDEELVANWFALHQNDSTSTRSHRISTLKGFSDYLKTVGVDVRWFPHPGYVGRQTRYTPYIYTEEEVRHIFSASDRLLKPRGDSMFHIVFPAVLKVLYCCGLRMSETLAIRVRDVDLEYGFIFVEQAKFESSRKLPISASLLEVLRAYRTANQELIGIDENGFFFPNSLGEKYSQRTVYDKFRTILWQSGISHQGKGKGPRVHDLRHTFAVRSLQQNILAGVDVYVSLPVLMSYLGHSKISSTEYYLRLTAEVFPDFLERADTVCSAAIPGVVSYED
jgi:integrase